MIDMVGTGNRIATLRKEAGYSIKDIQNFLDFESPGAIYKWEKGKSLPTIDNFLILADALHTTIDDLIVRK